jgi:hypothetical protein
MLPFGVDWSHKILRAGGQGRNSNAQNRQKNAHCGCRSEHRGVPLHDRVLATLRGLRHQQGSVFRTNTGRAYAEKESGGGQIKTAFKGACRRAGITDFTPHDCRHTWATWHYAANRDLIALMKLGGWKSERMVLRYAHVNVSQLVPSINAALAAWSTKSAPSKSDIGEKIRRVK